MSNEIPRRLVKVVDNTPALVAPEGLPPPEIGVGQIWIARPDEGPDVLVLVIEVRDDHVQAVLCSHDDGLATETDAVLEPGLTGYRGRLLVHSDLAGTVLTARLAGSPGRIDPGLSDASSCVAAGWTSTHATSDGGCRCSATPIHAGTRRRRG